MRNILKLAAGVTAVAASLVAFTNPANAAITPPAGYGYDGTAHIITGGGSDTTYRAVVGMQTLYNGTGGCAVETTAGNAALNQCTSLGDNVNKPFANLDRDTVADANPTGSGAGIQNLGCGGVNGTYAGTASGSVTSVTGGTVNFARSSREPKPNEIGTGPCTFWGFAEDGIEVTAFDSRAADVQADAVVNGGGITFAELGKIFNCTFTKWSDIPSLGIAANSAKDGPIVVWGMNASSGTFTTWNGLLADPAKGNAGAGFNVDTTVPGCAHALNSGVFPFENDVKPILDDVQANGIPSLSTPAGLSTSATSAANPANWIWWGSFGELSSFPFKASETVGSTLHTTLPAPINGKIPSGSNILNNTYPATRTLYHVTLKTDAECPRNASSQCDFTNNPGPAVNGGTGTDLNVQGGTSGTSGAVREFTRFICRSATSTGQATDPYTGVKFGSEITTAVKAAGFSVVPTALVTPGSRCAVKT